MISQESLKILAVLSLAASFGVASRFANDQDRKSVCHQYHRINGTREVSYTETYYVRNFNGYHYDDTLATRINFRTETVTKWAIVEMCCEGYEPHDLAENAEECVPVCPGDCQNGHCHRPNLCACDDGYNVATNESTGNSECSPHCESGCAGGRCVAPNRCACDHLYSSVNDGTGCEPDCTEDEADASRGCGSNAVCVSPNACQCHEGYRPASTIYDFQQDDDAWRNAEEKELFRPSIMIFCKPVCEPKCDENAECIDPNDCRCNPGYQQNFHVNETHFLSRCIPICEQTCFNGFCTSPNECRCNDGYEAHAFLKSNLCEATCRDDCVNGKCTKPDHCECLDGYEKLTVRTGNNSRVSANVCIPVCPGDCSNGGCIAPGQCRCDPGYLAVNFPPEETTGNAEYLESNRTDKSWQTCRPICEPSCGERSVCVAPDRCQLRPLLDSDLNEYTIKRWRIVAASNDCGNEGVFRKRNDSCFCEYDYNCTESALCAVAILDDVASAGKFHALRRVAFRDDPSAAYNLTGETRNFHGFPKCGEECRISLLSKKNADFTKYTKMCFRLDIENETIAILSNEIEDLPSSIVNKNESLLCFVDSGFSCENTEIGEAEKRIRGIIGGAVGSILLIAIFLAFVMTIYLTRRKIFNARFFKGSCRNENVMERSEATDSPFHTDENSHL